MDLGIEGRIALVMGASQGIGKGIAAALAAEGAKVAMASRSIKRLDAAAADIDGETATFEADTADLDRLAALPQEVAERLGGPTEILVTNTGGPPSGGALDRAAEEWEDAYGQLVLAPRALIEVTLPLMRERGWGRIVNVGSSSTIEAIPHLALSNVHRMAAIGYFKTLAREVAGDGVTVNTVATGKIATDRLAKLSGSMDAAREMASEQVPAGRLGTPEEYGDLVAFLCSERAGYITGTTVPIDGGLLRAT
ncbi:MAG: SDR family oxidoreductase [Actinomycetota bacterium]|nr:SDR family oxidoreductase [Actinomycetota bacterium]